VFRNILRAEGNLEHVCRRGQEKTLKMAWEEKDPDKAVQN
jgi:hypothetical protein